MIDSRGKLYIGRQWEGATAKTGEEAQLYDLDDLTTHAVVVGMTGSGKTGLCIDILEEAALQGIPAIMIDPKGDITNTLLHFPELLPEDFAPWINPDEARRNDQSIEEAAEATAELWRGGLADWGISGDRIQALQDGASFAIYTPGSDAGLPVSILASLAAPQISWEENRELLREHISSTVTALLGLVGMNDVSPVTSREHVLLANLFENAWKNGNDLDLGELLMQIQNPPFEKVGYLETESFFPAKDRFALAAKFNNLLASPSFQAWIEGDPLDIQAFMLDSAGRPRHTVFYIAHLNDQERMFFVTLLFSSIEMWMRSQSGTSSLRTLVYFDEIFGYLPPIASPPSKEPMLRLLKQARAFGLGLILATQNPVDLDYKALSNAGTWFIGRLATAQDKERLLDGLGSATDGSLDRHWLSDAISSLGKRVFVARNVHDKEPALFQTRWAMNYLAGPMTRVQIPALNELAGAEGHPDEPAGASPASAAVRPAKEPASGKSGELSRTRARPPVPKGFDELFLAPGLDLEQTVARSGRKIHLDAQLQGILWRPILAAQLSVRYIAQKYNLRHELQRAFLVHDVNTRANVAWEEYAAADLDLDNLNTDPGDDALFAPLEPPLSSATGLRELKGDLVDWAYRQAPLSIRANHELGVYADPDVDDAEFEDMLTAAADKEMQADIDKLEELYRRKLESLDTKLQREQRELAEDEAEAARRKQEEYTSYAETLFSFLGGRRRSLSSALSRRGRRTKAEDDVQESHEEIANLQGEIEVLQGDLERELDELEQKWERIAENVAEVDVAPYKRDIDVQFFGLAWLPYYLLKDGSRAIEIPAFDLGHPG